MGLFKKPTVVGIDIGHFAIKVVQAERTNVGWRIKRQGYIATPEEAVKDGMVVDVPAVGQAIKALLAEQQIAPGLAMVGVSGASVVVRPSRISKMPEENLRRSIRFESGRYVPASPDENYIEFEITGYPDDESMDIVVVAAPKELVLSRINACEEAGLEVEAVEVEAFSSYRSIIEADKEHNWLFGNIAVLEIGANNTNIVVSSRGQVAMTRTVPMGGQILTSSLKNYFKMELGEAEEGKTHLNVADLLKPTGATEQPPLRVVQPHIDDLVREVRRSMNYLQTQNQTGGGEAVDIEGIILTGGGSRLAGLDEYLEAKVGVPCRVAGIFDNPRFVSPTLETAGGAEYCVAAGLAMRGSVKAA